MSLTRHNDFLRRDKLPIALDVRDLGVPTGLDIHGKVQLYSFPAGFRFSILSSDRTKIGHFVVVSYANWSDLGGKFQVQNVVSDQSAHLSNWQISQLERQGRFIPHESKLTGRVIESSIALDPEQRKEAERKLGYVVAILRENGRGTVLPERKVVLRAALKHAREVGDAKPYCYNTLKDAIRAYIENPFNRLLAVAPAKSRGNRARAYPDRLEDLFREAAEYAWSLPKGTALDARRRYEELLLLPENEDLLAVVSDDEGNIVTPHQTTIERRMYGVDHFTRDVLRKDLETALRIHDLRIPQLLPEAPLEVVEVDYTTLDVVVYDDLYAFIFGRPNIILFRDRMSAGILGLSIFFGDPSFEAFLHGFKQAIYPKDMSAYPGLDWSMHGMMSILVVDADPHLQSEKMRSFCDEIGVTLHEVRPGEPNSKGGIERTFRTLNESLIHNVPGTTLSNPVRRKEGGRPKEFGTPKITLAELERHLTAWACDYNRTSHKGLGFLRSLKGVPQHRFDANIHRAGQRRPIDPEIFARLSGEQHEAAIQDGCIVWDHIIYTSPELVVMATSPTSTPPNRARARKPRKPTTLYNCFRDPSDIGHIYVRVPGADTTVKVPAAPAYANYASGLRLFQHRKAIEHYNKRSRRPLTNVKDLQAALVAYGEDLSELHAERKKHKTAATLAAFYRGVATKHRRSRILEPVSSPSASSGFIDYARPFAPPPVKRTSQAADDYHANDTPPVIHERDEHGQLVPTDPLAAKVREHVEKGGPKRKASSPEKRGKLSGYDDTDDIDELRKRFDNDEDDT